MSTSTERMRRLRARRAALIEAGDGPPLRDADELLAPAVEETLSALELTGGDQAAAQLARQYAVTIDRAKDQAWALRWIGPHLLDTLASLQATPASRKPGKAADRRPTRLDELRAARTAGKRPGSL